MAINTKDKHGARYRRVSIETYADQKFKALTPMRPSGQSLWLYLLTGPFSTLIPGICVGGEAGIAERLGWPLAPFRRCFKEIAAQDMARADWQGPVIWLPKALRHNPPQNPSVVAGWRQSWAEVPACPLKAEAAQVIAEILRVYGETYATAFSAFAIHSPSHQAAQDASHHVRHDAPHQEQEQEQEQEYTPNPSVGSSGHGNGPGHGVSGHPLEERQSIPRASVAAFDRFFEIYPNQNGRVRANRAWIALNPDAELSTHIIERLQQRLSLGWGDDPTFVPQAWRFLDEKLWQERYVARVRGGRGQEASINGMATVRACPGCSAMQDGVIRNGRPDFPSCDACGFASDAPGVKEAVVG